MRKAMALLSLFLLSCLAGCSVADASPRSLAVQVSVELFESTDTVAANVTVANTNDVFVAVSVSDAYGIPQSFSISPGETYVVTRYTDQTAVLGYTVQVTVKSSDGRSSARGYSGGTLIVSPSADVPPMQYPDRYCEGPRYDFFKCMAQWMNVPI